jgi:hypothetical protein
MLIHRPLVQVLAGPAERLPQTFAIGRGRGSRLDLVKHDRLNLVRVILFVLFLDLFVLRHVRHIEDIHSMLVYFFFRFFGTACNRLRGAVQLWLQRPLRSFEALATLTIKTTRIPVRFCLTPSKIVHGLRSREQRLPPLRVVVIIRRAIRLLLSLR